MNIRNIKDEKLKPMVGDIIEFLNPSENKSGQGFYLICQNNMEGTTKSQFFLINLNGRKGGEIKYYNSLKHLLSYHEGKYKLYSSDKFELAIMEKGTINE